MSVTEMYREGDVVRLTKGDLILQGPVRGTRAPYIFLEKDFYLIDALENGWAIDIVKRVTEVVPTEPGIYRDTDGDFWVLDDGVWYLYQVGDYGDHHEDPDPIDGYFPLTRLEEVE